MQSETSSTSIDLAKEQSQLPCGIKDLFRFTSNRIIFLIEVSSIFQGGVARDLFFTCSYLAHFTEIPSQIYGLKYLRSSSQILRPGIVGSSHNSLSMNIKTLIDLEFVAVYVRSKR